MSRILVIDDEPSICWAFEQALSENGHVVSTASTAESGLQAIDEFDPELILLDFRLPGMDGLSALREFRAVRAQTPVILMTAFGNLDLAVDAMGQGVFDYLPKPFDLDDAVAVVSRALSSLRTDADAASVPENWNTEIVGVSREMQEVFRQIAMVAKLNVPVLITGESGVGKELVARAIHRYSGRDPNRFVPICVPALSESVLESELFGHVRGAFTGAERTRPGLLQQAHLGTAFFDEIGDIPIPHQVKLLRVLDNRQILPVGGDQEQHSEFRLIAATHRSLESLVANGQFREDLYYRLNVFRIHIPPLRERPDDVPVLVKRFLAQVTPDGGISVSPEALDELQHRQWRGNVRELRSVVQHAAVTSRGGMITPDCLPAESTNVSLQQSTDVDRMVEDLRRWAERQLPLVDPHDPASQLYERFLSVFEPPILLAALAAANGSRKSAAELLGLHRETLRKRLRKHGLDEGDAQEGS